MTDSDPQLGTCDCPPGTCVAWKPLNECREAQDIRPIPLRLPTSQPEPDDSDIMPGSEFERPDSDGPFFCGANPKGFHTPLEER